MNKSRIKIFINPYSRKPWRPCFYSLERNLLWLDEIKKYDYTSYYIKFF